MPARHQGVGINPISTIIMIVIISILLPIATFVAVSVLNNMPGTDATVGAVVNNTKTQIAAAFNLLLVLMIVMASVAIIGTILILRYIAG